MKVLFAVSNENISEAIVKKYQKDYKEIISYKNVYYFNAIIKEIQRDKSYDRIVISEDLEPFANNNYDTIDKFLFEKLDSISDEAADNNDKEAQIILICADRRSKSDSILVKLFGIGIYSALLGSDRSIEEVCRLIDTPRTKKEAKQYYKIEAEDVSYQTESDTDVNENEIQSIIKHYKKLGKNEEKYVESFDNISSQYTDAQLRIIIKFLPLNVKAVLESNSSKYQEIVTFGERQYKKQDTSGLSNTHKPLKEKGNKKEKTPDIGELKIDAIEKRVNNPMTGKPIIIPSEARKAHAIDEGTEGRILPQPSMNQIEDIGAEVDEILNNIGEETEIEEDTPMEEETTKKGRGRPRKFMPEEIEPVVKKGRGRPRKEEPLNLYDINEEEPELDDDDIEDLTTTPMPQAGVVLPGFEDEEEEYDDVPVSNEEELTSLPGLDDFDEEQKQETYTEPSEQDNVGISNPFGINSRNDINSLLTQDKKIVSFVGTTKNGTSFMVNNIAMLLSSMGINTAIIDATENKNSYYIFTENEENLRKIASDSMSKLKSGVAEGIKVNKNLTVYTAIPGEEKITEGIEAMLSTLVGSHSLVLIDCDFNTPVDYFALSQETYLVQTMDVLTIQPLTSFLRDLKNKGVLNPEKLRAIVNKTTKIKGVSAKVIVGGMANYNDPSMSFMTELFNKETITFFDVPFNIEVYSRYLEAMATCNLSIGGYPRQFMVFIKEIGSMVYPLLSKNTTYNPKQVDYSKNNFSQDMNDTLNQMKKKY